MDASKYHIISQVVKVDVDWFFFFLFGLFLRATRFDMVLIIVYFLAVNRNN